MTRSRLVPVIGIAFILLLLGLGGGIWWYLFGGNKIEAAELVPTDTVAFATIPNAATIVAGYRTSQLKTLVDSPNMQPLIDSIRTTIGQKNLDLLTTFLPSLSGQSFIAVTHFDSDHPEQIGFVAAMKPKTGLSDFNAFVEKLKTSWPELTKGAETGNASVGGVDYQWIKGPGAPDKLCVAQVNGWIVTTWGEASLLDWIQRYQHKGATPSLAQNPDYQKTLIRLGNGSMALGYLNYHSFLEIMQKQTAKTNPSLGDSLEKKLGAVGGFAVGTRFENGEIVDRFSMLMPRQAQLDNGMSGAPCPFETLKFTGPATRFYWGSSINWKQYWKIMQEDAAITPPINPMASSIVNTLKQVAQGANLDLQHNVIDALGSEFSIQLDWTDDASFPEVALFLKVDKPDDFKATTAAIIAAAHQATQLTAVVDDLSSSQQNFSVLKFVKSSPLSPTMTKDGPYFGLFSTETYAVRAFERNPAVDLTHNADFIRQIGDKRNGASQVLFLDSPQLLNRAYGSAMPYLSMASMFNKQVADMLKGKNLPPDLTWLAPVGTWSLVATTDNDGINFYSTSGIGNQGILLIAAGAGAMTTAQSMGFLPKQAPAGSAFQPEPAPVTSPADIPISTPPPAMAPSTPAPEPAPEAAPSTPATNAPVTPTPSDAPKPQ